VYIFTQGPGGDSERFAAQLVYDSVLSQILVNGVVQDSELVREVLSAGSEELCGIGISMVINVLDCFQSIAGILHRKLEQSQIE